MRRTNECIQAGSRQTIYPPDLVKGGKWEHHEEGTKIVFSDAGYQLFPGTAPVSDDEFFDELCDMLK